MRRFAGACWFVFNKALALQKERYEQGQKKLGYAGLCKRLTEWRGGGETPWLKDAPVQPLQQTLKDLERAYKVQRLHTRIAHCRKDDLHKATTTISQNHAMVCIEDLQERNMSKSTAGTADAPGKNVQAKSGLNQAILDQGGFEFRRQLEYKRAWNGGMLVAVPPHNTSKTCPSCGHVSADNRKTQVQFLCMRCGHEDNADVVGAIHVLRAGQARLACGEDVSRAKPAKAQRAASVKQEPAEVSQAEA